MRLLPCDEGIARFDLVARWLGSSHHTMATISMGFIMCGNSHIFGEPASKFMGSLLFIGMRESSMDIC